MLSKQFEDRVINIRRAKKGSPCYWENTKNFDTMKRITHVFDSEGNKKNPIFTKADGDLVPIVEGDYLLKIFFEDNKPCDINKTEQTCTFGEGIGISILKIQEIDKYKNIARTKVVMRKPSETDAWFDNSDNEETTSTNIIMNNITNLI